MLIQVSAFRDSHQLSPSSICTAIWCPFTQFGPALLCLSSITRNPTQYTKFLGVSSHSEYIFEETIHCYLVCLHMLDFMILAYLWSFANDIWHSVTAYISPQFWLICNFKAAQLTEILDFEESANFQNIAKNLACIYQNLHMPELIILSHLWLYPKNFFFRLVDVSLFHTGVEFQSLIGSAEWDIRSGTS